MSVLSATYLLSMPSASFREAARGCARGVGLLVLKGSWNAVVVAVFCIQGTRMSGAAWKGIGRGAIVLFPGDLPARKAARRMTRMMMGALGNAIGERTGEARL